MENAEDNFKYLPYKNIIMEEEKLLLPYEMLIQKLQDKEITHLQFIKSQTTFDIDYMGYLRGSERTEDEESALDFLDFVDERSLNGQTYGL